MSASAPPSQEAPIAAFAAPSTNPGSYEELHRKCRDVFPMCFEGAKVMVQKALSSHFQVCFFSIVVSIFMTVFSVCAWNAQMHSEL